MKHLKFLYNRGWYYFFSNQKKCTSVTIDGEYLCIFSIVFTSEYVLDFTFVIDLYSW